ncbi:MAG: hypothetical protein WBO77_02605 [Microgenomates group bacterium]
MKNDAMLHDCPVCRVLNQAENNRQDISLVELKISFKSSRDDLDDDMDWVNDTPED